MITLKALGALLAYPGEDLMEALPEIRRLLADEPLLSAAAKRDLAQLGAALEQADPLEAQEAYVALFDRGRATSLHLFEHVHGESRDRGQAMVDLAALYRKAGLRLAGNELPDYLPAVLEYLSLRPPAEVREMLGDCAHILRALGRSLRDRASPYFAVPAALLEIAGEDGLGDGAGPAEDSKSLDEHWAEEPVIFGPAAAADCGVRPSASVMQFMPKNALGDAP